MQTRRQFLRAALGASVAVTGMLARSVLAQASSSARSKPNIVIIISDDQGYADISFNPHHPKEVSTPHLDALARESVFFTQGYISGNVCSPTRAGLMTGRYQQRAGIYTAGEGGSGLPLNERIFPQFLKPAGYVCGAFGKWHLGLTSEYNPAARGFDEFYGFLGRGAHDYYKLDDPESPLYRNLDPVKDHGYLTTRLTDEAVSFIRRNKSRPFLAYLAYNAVHAPAQAPEEDIRQFNTGDPQRDILMAMLAHLDAGVGRVVQTLKTEGLWDNTLLFFLTDNGGAKAMHADNAPLRGCKQQNYEGGIRTPFIVSWPAQVKGGRFCDTPVISLDLLPTALAVVGLEPPKERPFDGRSLLPLLRGETKVLHEHLFWSEGGSSGEWAVRSGNWKLVASRDQRELYDLGADPAEETNLAQKHPDKVKQLSALYDSWLDQMAPPNSGAPKRWGETSPANALPKDQTKQKKREERKKTRAAKKNGG